MHRTYCACAATSCFLRLQRNRLLLQCCSISPAPHSLCLFHSAQEPSTDGFQLECKASVGGAVANANVGDGSFGADAVFQFQPCGDPAQMGFTATITVAGTDYPLENQSLKAGTTAHVPVPDASIADVGGVFVDASLDGNASQLSVDLSLDVCASVLGLEKCGLIPGVVPLELYKGELDFSDVCTSMNAMKSLRGAITTE